MRSAKFLKSLYLQAVKSESYFSGPCHTYIERPSKTGQTVWMSGHFAAFRFNFKILHIVTLNRRQMNTCSTNKQMGAHKCQSKTIRVLLLFSYLQSVLLSAEKGKHKIIVCDISKLRSVNIFRMSSLKKF